jgi:hypothetical protein
MAAWRTLAAMRRDRQAAGFGEVKPSIDFAEGWLVVTSIEE